jgi:type I restriction enzyme S subunit
MSDISVIARGGSPRPIQQYLTEESDGVNWIKIGDANGKYINSTQQKIKPEGVSRSRLVHKGDFLLTNSMSFGKPYILNIDGCIHDGWLVISPMRNSFDKEFLYYLLSSDFAYYQFSKVAGGAVVSNLNSDKVADTFVPMPPIREQINIVKAIEKWFSILDEIECTKSNLSLLIANAKSKILDLAIAGKLVPQSASDEPAIEALRRINPSFQPCDNPQYQHKIISLPNTWCCATFDSINTYKSASVNPASNPNEIYELYSVPTFETGMPEFIIGDQIASTKALVKSRDVLLCKINPHLNRAWVVSHHRKDLRCIASSEWIVFRNEALNSSYMQLCLTSPYFKELMMSNVSGVGGSLMRAQPIYVKKYTIPIPPIAEQQRIVDKVNELFTILDSIQNSLDAN